MTHNTLPVRPKVSICSITYNHAAYIKQCLDSILTQQTDFPFELIIYDDCSTDGTTDIIREYERKYPDIIRPLYQEINQFSQGIRGTLRRIVLPLVRGEYVALCEGDDYWTDPQKLQKQVHQLDEHKDCAICFHPSTVKWEKNLHADYYYPSDFSDSHVSIHTIHDLLKENFIPTASVMYRWPFDRKNNKIEEACPPLNMLPGDWLINLLVAEHGNILFLNEPMSVYRKHAGGIWWGEGDGPNSDFYARCSVPFLRFYHFAEKRFNADFSDKKKKLIQDTIPNFIKRGEKEQLNELEEIDPELYQSILLEMVLSYKEVTRLNKNQEETQQIDNEKKQLQNKLQNTENDNARLEDDNTRLKNEIRRFEDDNTRLKNEIRQFEDDNTRLTNEIRRFEGENSGLQIERTKIRKKVKCYRKSTLVLSLLLAVIFITYLCFLLL